MSGVPMPQFLSYAWRGGRRGRGIPIPPTVPDSSSQEDSDHKPGEDSASQNSPIAEIEATTRRRVAMSIDTSGTNISKCNPQTQCPLFNTLPAELRSKIFAFATQPTLDPANIYAQTDFFYRPDHPGKSKTSTSLLRTCRLIWLEANHLPLQQAESVFFFKDRERQPTWAKRGYRSCDDSRRLREFLERLAHHRNNRDSLGELRLFTQMYWLEEHFFNNMKPLFGSLGAAPRILTLTVKHTDWWHWEEEMPLAFKDDCWLRLLLAPQFPVYFQEIRLELETIMQKKGELQALVDRIRAFDVSSLHHTLVRGQTETRRWVLQDPPAERRWTGTANLGPQNYDYTDRRKNWTCKGEGIFDYWMTAVVWKSVAVASDDETTHDVWVLNDRVQSGPQLSVPLRGFNESLVGSQAAAQWREKWMQQGSLLEFVS